MLRFLRFQALQVAQSSLPGISTVVLGALAASTAQLARAGQAQPQARGGRWWGILGKNHRNVGKTRGNMGKPCGKRWVNWEFHDFLKLHNFRLEVFSRLETSAG